MDGSVAVVICTKDRPDALADCLTAVGKQTRIPDLTVVVDSSGSRPDWYLKGPPEFPGRYLFLTSTAGLTIQRNLALQTLDPEYEYLLFLDDDSLPESEYVAEVVRAFNENPTASGVAGRIVNLPDHFQRKSDTLMGLTGPPGSILHSGVNIINQGSGPPRPTQWASGCCMSFRASAIHGLRFDECRNGYGLGEDVDFSIRASARGRLIYWPNARIDHLESPVNRDSTARIARQDVIHRWKLAYEGLGGVTRLAITTAIVSNAARQLAIALRQRSRRPATKSLAQLQGVADVLIRKRHRDPRMFQ